MYLELFRDYISDTPTITITEEFSDIQCPDRKDQYDTILKHIKDLFKNKDIFDYEYNIEIIYVKTVNGIDKFRGIFKSVLDHNNELKFIFHMKKSTIVKYEIYNPDYVRVIKNKMNDMRSTIIIGNNSQKVEGTSLVIDTQQDQFMRTMNYKFTKGRGV